MTIKEPDYIFYEGVKWFIDDEMEEFMDEPLSNLTPRPKDFGIHAIDKRASRLGGYLTNYMIFMGRLYLFKYDIDSIENNIEELAIKFRCEKNTTFSALDTYRPKDGMIKEICSEKNYSVYIDDHIIGYTGKIVAHGPHLNFWNQPTKEFGEEALEKELLPTKTMEIDFVEGRVKTINVSSYNDPDE